MTQGTQILIMKIMAVVQIFFGLLFVLAAYPPASGIADALVTAAGEPGKATADLAFQLAAVGGGSFMAAFGVVVWYLATIGMETAPDLVRKTLLNGMSAWFAFSMIGNIAAETYINIPSQIVVIAIWLLILRRPKLKTA